LSATQCATKWAQKFALLLIFLAPQEMETEIELMISKITDEMRQSS
jgi:hypothetical protein